MTSRALLYGSILVAVLWLAAGLVALSAIRQTATRQADAAGGNIAAAVEPALAQTIAMVDQSLRRVADGLRDPELQSLTPARRNEILFAGVAMLPKVAFFDALDANGDVIASLQPQEHATNWAKSDYFIAHRRDPSPDLLISRPFAAAQPDFAGIAISRRMIHPDGSFAGVVVCGIRLSYLREMFERLALGAHGAIALFRDDGIVLMRLPFDANTIGHSLDAAEPLAKAVRAGVAQMALDDPIDYVRRQFTLRRVGALPLVVAVGLTREDMQPGWWVDAVTMMAGCVLLAVLTVALALRLRRELHRREATEQETAAKGRILATMSHELRGPLHGLLGHADQLRMAGDLPARHAEHLDTIVNAGRRLREVIDRLLDYWRLEARGPSLQMRQVDIPGLLLECRAVVEPEARAKSLELACIVAPDAPRQFVTDSTSLHHVVLNLLANAVKFTRHGKVELRYDGNQDRIRIEVADTGPGIPANRRHRLFREYERLGADDTRTEGTGLGLSIADRLTRLMGGQIGHRDNPGGGSVFWIDLPAAAVQEAQERGVGEGELLPDRPLRILIVDDSDVHRDLASIYLGGAGHDVTQAEGGREAVRIADAQDFDVILMDMSMPDMNGIEVSRQIRALHGRRRAVPIIAVTANALDEDIERYRRAGLVDHVPKPFTKAELLTVVAAAVKRSTVSLVTTSPPPRMQNAAPLLDMELQTEFAASIGSERMAHHLAALADSVTALLTSLREYNFAAAQVKLAELAHGIAGDAGQLGFAALSVAARRFMEALEHDGDAVAPAATRLRAVAWETQTALRQRIEVLRCDFAQSTKPS